MLSRLSLIPRRAYTVIPRTPVQEQPFVKEEPENSIHALYNKEYEMEHTAAPNADQTHRTLSDAEHHHIVASADSFSPTFNTVFDE